MKSISRIIASAALLVTLAGCRNHATQSSAMELKVYSVPPAQTADLTRALNDSLSALKAHASIAMPGKVLIYAPHDTQASIGAAIDELAKSTPTLPAVQTPLRASFWMIDAHPGTGPDDPTLAPMNSLLNTLRVAMGPHHFSLIESVSGISSDTISSIRTGSGHEFQFKTLRNDQYIRFTVNYMDGNTTQRDQAAIGSMQTELTAQPGQYEVLARTLTATSGDARQSDDAPQTLRLLVARVDMANPAK